MSIRAQQKMYEEDFWRGYLKDINRKHAECKRKAKHRIQETRNMTQEIIEATVANFRSGEGSETKEKLEEFISKYEILKEVLIKEPGSLAMQSSSSLGDINIITEYGALASSIIHIMKQAEDHANNKDGDDCGAEGGPALFVQLADELAKNIRRTCGSGDSEDTRRAELSETVFEFSDLLEAVNREIHLLDKVTVHFQSFFCMLEGLCSVKKIGKLKADKVMLAARDLDRSCSAYISLVNESS